MADHRSDGLAREVFRLHESENPPAIRRGARGYTRKHMSVMTSAKVNRSNDRRPLPHDPIPEKDQSWKKTHGESWKKTHGFVLGSQCALSRTSSASLCAMVQKKAETAREALPALVAQLSKQANVPDHALTKQYGQLRVLSGKVSYSDETMKAVAAEVKRLIEANRTQQIQDQMIKAAPSPTKMMQTITRTAPRFHQDSPVQHVSMMSGPLRRWTSAASFSPNAVGSNSWAKILAGISFAGLSMASLASECPLMMAWAQASVSESNLHPTLNQINESGTLGDAGHIETKRHLTQEQIKLFTRLSTRANSSCSA